jgi:3-oxoacyl-[acyl-carrier-protein] synthase-3
MHEVYFSGTGSLLPERVLTNQELERMVDTSDEWITQRTGIRERRIIDKNESTSDIAAAAARKAVLDAGLTPEEIDCIILATVTPDTYCPAGAVYVQKHLGASRAFAFDVNAACTGFIYGTAVGSAFIRSGMHQHVLVIGAEALSRVVDYTDRNSCILFGDGAGAAMLSRAPAGGGSAGTGRASRIIDCYLRSDGNGHDLIEIPAGGSRTPASAETVAGKAHCLRLKGKEVFKFATKAMVELIETTVARNGIKLSDLDLIIPHQVNYRIIEAAQRKLEIPQEKIFLNLERYGNTSAASIPIALDEAARAGKLRRGDLVLLVAFGAGLTWGYNLIRW